MLRLARRRAVPIPLWEVAMGPRNGCVRASGHWGRASTIVALLAACMPQVLWGQPPLSQTGRWSADSSWAAIAVHMVLSPGNAPYHSQVLWWQAGHQDTLFGGLWGWTPAADNCTPWPGNSFVNIPIDPPSLNIFCGGQTHLADGKVLAGGTEIGTENGMTHLTAFDPLQEAWVQQESMHERQRDDRGNALRAGIYMYRLKAGTFEARRKMAMVP